MKQWYTVNTWRTSAKTQTNYDVTSGVPSIRAQYLLYMFYISHAPKIVMNTDLLKSSPLIEALSVVQGTFTK